MFANCIIAVAAYAAAGSFASASHAPMTTGAATSTIIAAVATLGLANPAAAMRFTAYDCTADNATFQPIDLTKADECGESALDYGQEERLDMMIVQTTEEMTIVATTCKVLETKTLTRCGVN